MRIILASFSEIGLQKSGVPQEHIPQLLPFLQSLPENDQKWVYNNLIKLNPNIVPEELKSAYQKWKASVSQRQVSPELVRWANQIHPKYVEWLVIQRQKNQLPKEDEPKAKEILRAFDALKNKPNIPQENKDINRYHSLSDVYDFVQQNQSLEDQSFIFSDPNDHRIVYNQNKVTILKIDNPEEAIQLSQNTNWCVKQGLSTAKSYTDRGALFFVFVNNEKSVLIHPQSGQIKDVLDRPLNNYILIETIAPALKALNINNTNNDFKNFYDLLTKGREQISLMEKMTDKELEQTIRGQPGVIQFITQNIVQKPIVQQTIVEIFNQLRGVEHLSKLFEIYNLLPSVVENNKNIRQALMSIFIEILSKPSYYTYYDKLHNTLKKESAIQDATVECVIKRLEEFCSNKYDSLYFSINNIPDMVSKRLNDKNLPPGFIPKLKDIIRKQPRDINYIPLEFQKKYPEIIELAVQSLYQQLSEFYNKSDKQTGLGEAINPLEIQPDYENTVDSGTIFLLFSNKKRTKRFIEKFMEDPKKTKYIQDYFAYAISVRRCPDDVFEEIGKTIGITQKTPELKTKQAQGYAAAFEDLVQRLNEVTNKEKDFSIYRFEIAIPDDIKKEPVLQPALEKLLDKFMEISDKNEGKNAERSSYNYGMGKNRRVDQLIHSLPIPTPCDRSLLNKMSRYYLPDFKAQFPKHGTSTEWGWTERQILSRAINKIPVELIHAPCFSKDIITYYFDHISANPKTSDWLQYIPPSFLEIGNERASAIENIFTSPLAIKFLRPRINTLLENEGFESRYTIKLLIGPDASPVCKKISQDPEIYQDIEIAVLQSYGETIGEEQTKKIIDNIINTALSSKGISSALHPILLLNAISKYSPMYKQYITAIKDKYVPTLLKRFPKAYYYLPEELRKESKNWYGFAKTSEQHL